VQGIQRQVEILDALSEAPESGVSITKLCVATGLPKGTVHRMLESLRGHGIAIQEEDSKRWRLGPRVAFWAGKYLEGPTALAPLRRFAGRLSQETQFFAYLTVLNHGHLVCVAVERPERKAQFFVQLGSRIPVLYAAGAKALLSRQPAETVRSLVERAIAENPSTRFETVTVESYLDELAQARRDGYAKCMEELEAGVSALGAPIVNMRDLAVASLSVVAPTAALVEEWDATIKKLLLVAEEASMMLGRERENKATG
jgi:IclR family transcriptional regulator, KDG regulon repressor